MKILFHASVLASCALIGCSSASTSTPVPSGNGGGTSPTAKRAYNGTASVGDFLSISVDPNTKTIAYSNHSNGDSGTATYTIRADGSYALADPSGDLVSAYEVPGYALIIAATKVGPDHATPALITAVESGPISPATFSGHTYNFMQFRTAAGGFEAGAITIDKSGQGSGGSYWPYGPFNQNSSPINSLSHVSVAGAVTDPSGTFFKIDTGAETAYIFGTANGQFLVDTPNGAILGLQQAASSAFDPAYAGTYGAMLFEKTDARTGVGNVEVGNPALKNATIVIDSSANISVKDAGGSDVLTAKLTPVADVPYLVGPGLLPNACPGLFTFRLTTATTRQDMFVAFAGHALLFASFTGQLPVDAGRPYSYSYGVGIH